MARKLSKMDNKVWDFLTRSGGWLSISYISENLNISPDDTILSINNLLAHAVIKKELHLYRSY
jgi:predicted transcriptional regulator